MIHLHDWYVACLVHFYPELVVKVLKNTNDERFDQNYLLDHFPERTITIHKNAGPPGDWHQSCSTVSWLFGRPVCIRSEEKIYFV